MNRAVVVAAVVVSLAPALLPRTSAVQGVVTGALILVASAVSMLVRRVRPVRRAPHADERELRILGTMVAAAAIVLAVTAAHHRENELRAAMALAPVGVRHWMEVLVIATIVAGSPAVLARVVAVVVQRLGRLRTGVAAAAVLVMGVGTALAPSGIAGPVAAPAGPQASPNATGAASVPWQTLGHEGRRFVSIPSAGTPIRVYVPLTAGPDAATRAEVAVRELVATGGFDRAHLVVAVPTGSGWVDAGAVRGFEARWGDDVAFVAQQYSDLPSWMTFVLDREGAAESARTLVSTLRAHLATLPPEHRPELHVYGQSLGAAGAAAVHSGAVADPCAVVLAGPPAGVRAAGATVLANRSDPVVWWEPSLLWSPPDLSGTRPDAPAPRWLPLVTFVQTTIDLFTSLEAPTGHGHRYGEDQARCDR